MPVRNLPPPSAGVLSPEEERHRGRYYGDYAGFVRDVNDPEKRGRVKVWVPALLGDKDRPQSWLDWCQPASCGLNVPPVGTPVWVTFEHGMVEHGNYRWGWFRGNSEANSEAPSPTDYHTATTARTRGYGPEIRANVPADPATVRAPVYPWRRVFQSHAGHVLELDDSPSETVGQVVTGLRARYRHPSGTKILVEADGSVHIISKGAVYNKVDGDYVVQLGRGASFKVVYPDGSGIVVGSSGFHVSGDQATIIGRSVIPGGSDILWQPKTPQRSARPSPPWVVCSLFVSPGPYRS